MICFPMFLIFMRYPTDQNKRVEITRANTIATTGTLVGINHNYTSPFFGINHFKYPVVAFLYAITAPGTIVINNLYNFVFVVFPPKNLYQWGKHK